MDAFSIIICTYNPNFRIFNRLLNATCIFNLESPLHEVIVVDNNSTPSLHSNSVIQNFLLNKHNATVIQEKTPGLTAARIAGIKHAKYNWLIFFDDDNEPDEDYLIKAEKAIKQNQVAVWGPGRIKVEYTDISNAWLNKHKVLFQERNNAETLFENKLEWQDCYPFGTGMIIRKEVALEYANRVHKGIYTLSDRKGKSLESGGDVQMVYTAIEMGYAAGVIKGIHLVHLIDANKANLPYMCRQQYSTASVSIKAYNQVFIREPLVIKNVTNKQIILRIYSLYRIYRREMCKEDFQLILAARIGEINATVVASDQKKPFFLRILEQLLHV